MKGLFLIAWMLFSSNVAAVESYVVGRDWVIPVTREGGELLELWEISHHTMYRVNCATGVQTGEIIYPDLFNSLTVSYWISNTPVDCFRMTTTDIDNRTSRFSGVFQAVEWNSPSPPSCGLVQ